MIGYFANTTTNLHYIIRTSTLLLFPSYIFSKNLGSHNTLFKSLSIKSSPLLFVQILVILKSGHPPKPFRPMPSAYSKRVCTEGRKITVHNTLLPLSTDHAGPLSYHEVSCFANWNRRKEKSGEIIIAKHGCSNCSLSAEANTCNMCLSENVTKQRVYPHIHG